MGGNSDLERRIMRLEQAIPHVRQRIVKVGELNGRLVQLLSGGGIRTSNDGQPTSVYHDSVCNLDLGSTLTATMIWGITNEFSGTITLDWDSANSWWRGCAALHWPGSFSVSGGGSSYDSTVACDSPVQVTLIPSGSPTTYSGTIDLFVASNTNGSGYTMNMPAAGTCSATFNVSWNATNNLSTTRTSCSPFTVKLTITGSSNLGSQTQGGITETAFWNLGTTITSP